MSTRALLIAGSAVAAVMFGLALCLLIWEPGHIASDLFGLVSSMGLMFVVAHARRTERRRTAAPSPAPRSVSEGCSDNRREVGDDV